ncbi:MAG: bifunctional folylpolyglutamate synthase/dihydrofolate synthase [Synechococcaceae cyanobacterium]
MAFETSLDSRLSTPPLPAPVELGDLLEPFASRGIDLGLHRLEAALAEAGHPERRFPAVQVAGTNGKGSICTMLHAILQAAGLRVASYRSPHLVSWCERIQLGPRWITPEELRSDLCAWQPLARRHNLTPFELLTAAAFGRFALEDLDLVVLEVGLGGRLDATTAHPDRRLVGFASIGLDHREHLGQHLAAIAAEKAAVLRPGQTAFSASQSPEAAAVLEAMAERLGVALHWLEPLPDPSSGGPELGLPGGFQRRNGAVAMAMARALTEQGWPIGEDAIRLGLAKASWPGRLELRHWRGQNLLLDGAHNPPAAASLRQELSSRDGLAPRSWLLGIQRHKEAGPMLRALLLPGDQAFITPIAGHASWEPQALAQICPELASQLHAVTDLDAGLARLLRSGDKSDAQGPHALPVVAGSLYLLGEELRRMAVEQPCSQGSEQPS